MMEANSEPKETGGSVVAVSGSTEDEEAEVETKTQVREEGEEKPAEKEKEARSTSGVETKTTLPFNPLLFGKYDLTEVQVKDPGLVKYINLTPTMNLHSGARHANKLFGKMNVNIVERLINGMMRTEHYTGKKFKAYRVVKEAMELIEKRANRNPVQVLVDAIENASPIEQTTRLRYGGINVPKAVDTSSSRRVDIALRNICVGAKSKSFKTKKRIAKSLADEILLAANGSMDSIAIKKKEEAERIAKSAR
jgi:small subunit ribosomal protein S7